MSSQTDALLAEVEKNEAKDKLISILIAALSRIEKYGASKMKGDYTQAQIAKFALSEAKEHGYE